VTLSGEVTSRDKPPRLQESEIFLSKKNVDSAHLLKFRSVCVAGTWINRDAVKETKQMIHVLICSEYTAIFVIFSSKNAFSYFLPPKI